MVIFASDVEIGQLQHVIDAFKYVLFCFISLIVCSCIFRKITLFVIIFAKISLIIIFAHNN